MAGVAKTRAIPQGATVARGWSVGSICGIVSAIVCHALRTTNTVADHCARHIHILATDTNDTLGVWLREVYINGSRFGLANPAVDGFFLDEGANKHGFQI